MEYIQFAEQIDDIEKIYRSMPQYPHIYDNEQIVALMQELEKDILRETKGMEKYVIRGK